MSVQYYCKTCKDQKPHRTDGMKTEEGSQKYQKMTCTVCGNTVVIDEAGKEVDT